MKDLEEEREIIQDMTNECKGDVYQKSRQVKGRHGNPTIRGHCFILLSVQWKAVLHNVKALILFSISWQDSHRNK